MTAPTIQLEVLNWDKFNPRKDVKSTSWFRKENSIFENADFFEFDHSELCFWDYVLCIASKKQSPTITINISHAMKIGRFTKLTISSALEKLTSLQCVRVDSDVNHADVTATLRIRHATNERTDTHADVTETNVDARNVTVRERNTHAKPSADSATAELGKQSSEVIAKYCELWKAKYKTQPSFSGKWAGNAKTLVKDHGLKKALDLVEAFLEMNDTWFIQNRHSFDMILTKLSTITHYAGTGVTITKNQLHQIDKTQTNMDLLAKVRNGEA